MDLMCSNCRKRPAVVFMSGMNGNQKFEKGYCLKCAKELGIPQVDEYLKKMGLSDIDLDSLDNGFFFSAPNENDSDDVDDEDIVGEDIEDEDIGDEEDYPFDEDDDELNEEFDDDGNDGHDNSGDEDAVDGFKAGGTMPAFFQRFFQAQDNSSDPEKRNPRTGSRKESKKKRPKRYKFLDTFCENLTKKASSGKIDRVVGRDKEMARVIQILSRRTKNNPCLIGEPGVGKTAIAEGLALKMASGDVPEVLKDKELYLLDLTSLVAGTQFRGQFESRVKSLITDIKEHGNVILFIDEVHKLVGTGDSEGSMNAANMFKPALSRGELHVIGATTFNEYRKYIEKDSALERRFQPVTVNEPTIDETVELLKGIKNYYETHHKLVIPDAIIEPCVKLSERYITDRYLPDKAIDLLDESCAYATLHEPKYNEMYEVTREVTEANTALSTLQEKTSDNEEDHYEKVAKLKTKLAQLNDRMEELGNYLTGFELKPDALSAVIEMWTGVPAKKILETEFRRISDLESVLKSKVIGQDEACEKVAKAIKRSRVNLTTKRRPASFIFVGPTGVGKTQLVKVLAEELFSGVEPLIRLDMSEYMEKYSVSKIIGSPPGYVGYDEAGQLTEKVRRRPYSVILFDEIEKAHPDVMNILLQILDEGMISDSHGKKVDFSNTLICMTSNAGSSSGEAGLGFGKTSGDLSREKAMKALRDFLRPEFLGRVDDVIVFSQLTEENFAGIAKLQLSDTAAALAESGIKLDIDDSAYAYIARKAFGGKYGGRDILKVIREDVEDSIANLIISAGEEQPKVIRLSADDNGISVKQAEV